MQPKRPLQRGRRYRLRFRNDGDDSRPLHPHSHSFEVVGGKATASVLKDVVLLGGFHALAFDFVADNPGPPLFHRHQQPHTEFGFMALGEYA